MVNCRIRVGALGTDWNRKRRLTVGDDTDVPDVVGFVHEFMYLIYVSQTVILKSSYWQQKSHFQHTDGEVTA